MDRIDGVEEAHGAAIAEWCDRVQVEIEVGPVPSEQEWAAYMRARKVRDDLKRKREAAANRAFTAEVARRVAPTLQEHGWGPNFSPYDAGRQQILCTLGLTPADVDALAETGELPKEEE